jgi:hypothetical protein
MDLTSWIRFGNFVLRQCILQHLLLYYLLSHAPVNTYSDYIAKIPVIFILSFYTVNVLH